MHKDTISERALLAALVQEGFESYHAISTIGISEHSFADSTNKILYKCLRNLFENENVKKPDVPLILNEAAGLNLQKWIESTNFKDFLSEIAREHYNKQNISKYAQKIRKLEITNNICNAVSDIQDELDDITGQEKLSDIFGLVENKLSNLAGFLTDSSTDPAKFSELIRDHVQNLIENPIDQIGIPTGYPLLDKAIGGGLRRHAITVIGARAKVGKSTFCSNVARNVAAEGIPVLILDTEMETEDQINRTLSSISEVELESVETGKFGEGTVDKARLNEAIEKIEGLNIQHKNIAGMSIDAQLAIARKWIIRDVGLHKDGKAKECVLIYDYLKLMDDKELKQVQEYQALGFLMTKLQNFAVQYDIPILTAAQLNRDGIDKENTAAIGASDRIAQYCSSVSILKWKSHEEIDMESGDFGNQKLIPIISRYGPPMDGDYINIIFSPGINKMEERGLGTRSQKPEPRRRSSKKKQETDTDVEF